MILEHGVRPVDDSLRLVTHEGGGHRVVMRGDRGVCDDGDGTWAGCAKLAAQVPLESLSVAVIGGGLCVLPRLLRGCEVAVYEIEAALKQFCPCTFIAGDWRETLAGTYDCIIYDIGDQPDVERIRSHLADGGLLLFPDNVDTPGV